MNPELSNHPSPDILSKATIARAETGIIFQTGFESNTREVMKHSSTRVDDLVGQDLSVSTPNHWVNDLEAGDRKFWFNYVDNFNGPNPEILGAYIDKDPEDVNNQVFYTWQKDAEQQGTAAFSRVQAELNNMNWTEAYYKVRFRLSRDIALVNPYSKSDGFLSLIEFWTGERPYRSLNRIILHKWGDNRKFSNGTAPLQWYAEIQGGDKGHIFEGSGVQANYDEWQTLEFYVKSGDAKTGKFWVRLNESQVLFDKTVATKHPNAIQGIIDGNLLKSYGGPLVKEVKRHGGQVEIWYDDMEVWNRRPSSLARL